MNRRVDSPTVCRNEAEIPFQRGRRELHLLGPHINRPKGAYIFIKGLVDDL
jgi:hypothetical protein